MYVLVVAFSIITPFIFNRLVLTLQSNIFEESLPSVFNWDTGKNNQYEIKGRVKSLPVGIRSEDVFLNLYQNTKLNVYGLKLERWTLVKNTVLSSDLSFSFEGIGAGAYKIVPLTNHALNLYFPKSYQVDVRDHHPQFINISPPTSSQMEYIMALILTKIGK